MYRSSPMDALMSIVLMMKRLNLMPESVYLDNSDEVRIVANTIINIMAKEAGPGDVDVLRHQIQMVKEWAERMENIRRHHGVACPPSSIGRY